MTRTARQAAIAATATAFILTLGCGPKNGPDSTAPGTTGTAAAQGAAPDFELPAPGGETVRLSDFRGKVVVVDFWASWCAPCKKELPVLEALYKKYGEQGLVVVGVNLDEEKGDAMGMLEASGVTFPIGLDPSGETAQKYAPPKMPTSYIIDVDGNIAHVQAGYEPADAELLEEKIVGLLGD